MTENDIKKASLIKLEQIRFRLNREQEVRYLLERIDSEKADSRTDKSKSIVEASDEELRRIASRLHREAEVQNLISDINRKTLQYPGADVNTPIEALYHYGIKGQKWGVVRKRGSSGRVSGSKDYRQSRSLKSKGSKNLSTNQLNTVTKRLRLEKDFNSLNPTKYKKGMSFVKGITAAGTTVASLYALSKTPLGQDVSAAVKRKLSKKAG